jgi:L-threonylcarbamoyladenylate synthase
VTPPAADEIEAAGRAALRGELIVLPTDTVYGIGTRPDDPAATARLFEAKRRPRDLELPVLVPRVEAAREIAVFDERASRIAGSCWPGALTMVLPRTGTSKDWDLGGTRATIGVRMPRDPTALALLGRTGPLAVTSANLSGRRTPETCPEVEALFAGVVTVYLCLEGPLRGRPSTVLDLTAEPRVIREGAIPEHELLEVLGGPPLRPLAGDGSAFGAGPGPGKGRC